jgi:hypothetical protein
MSVDAGQESGFGERLTVRTMKRADGKNKKGYAKYVKRIEMGLAHCGWFLCGDQGPATGKLFRPEVRESPLLRARRTNGVIGVPSHAAAQGADQGILCPLVSPIDSLSL